MPLWETQKYALSISSSSFNPFKLTIKGTHPIWKNYNVIFSKFSHYALTLDIIWIQFKILFFSFSIRWTLLYFYYMVLWGWCHKKSQVHFWLKTRKFSQSSEQVEFMVWRWIGCILSWNGIELIHTQKYLYLLSIRTPTFFFSDSKREWNTAIIVICVWCLSHLKETSLTSWATSEFHSFITL